MIFSVQAKCFGVMNEDEILHNNFIRVIFRIQPKYECDAQKALKKYSEDDKSDKRLFKKLQVNSYSTLY